MGEFDWLLGACMGILAGKWGSVSIRAFLKKRGWLSTLQILKMPVPEVINGLLWSITFLVCETPIEKMLGCVLMSVLFCIAVVDGCVYEIPVLCNGVIACLGLVQVVTDLQHWASYVIGSILAGGIFHLVYWLTKKRGIGGGDIKLMAAAGLLLGVSKVLFALFFGCVLAVVVELPKKYRKKTNHFFALGPYLAVGISVMVWFGETIIQWYQRLR